MSVIVIKGWDIIFRAFQAIAPFLLAAVSAGVVWIMTLLGHINEQIDRTEVWMARASVSSFTKDDWFAKREIIDQTYMALERRVKSLEDTQITVVKSAMAAEANSGANKIMLQEIREKMMKP